MRKSRVLYGVGVLCMSALMLWPLPLEATVEEQRARLPPPAECQDPVEGIWLAHHFTARQRQWYLFTLTIRRTEPKSPTLKGEIESHFWDGGPKDLRPPLPCKPGVDEQIVDMPAKGLYDGTKVQFGGTSWKRRPAICGRASGTYYADSFSGVIDPKTQEFQSVNNDGGPAVNEPTVFRRIRCFETIPPPPTPGGPDVKPPPFEPPKRLGCGKS